MAATHLKVGKVVYPTDNYSSLTEQQKFNLLCESTQRENLLKKKKWIIQRQKELKWL